MKQSNKETDTDLEHHALYRLIKVVYYTAIIIAAILVWIIVEEEYSPTTKLDSDNSYVVCENSKSYPLRELGIWVVQDDGYLFDYQDETARRNCAISVYGQRATNFSTFDNIGYSLVLNDKQEGGLSQMVGYFMVGFGLSVLVIFMIRKALEYIIWGNHREQAF